MTIRRRIAGWIACTLICWSGSVAADAVTYWNEIAAAQVAAGRAGPIGQMDLALVAAAVHDAVQSIEKRHEAYYAEVPGATGSRSAAVAAATRDLLVAFYNNGATLDPIYYAYLADNGLTGNPGEAVGQAIAAKYVTLRRRNPDPLPTPFTGGTGIGEWRPTPSYLAGAPPTLSPMATPWMGAFDPFTLTGPARYRAAPPPAVTSAAYVTAYNEVKALGRLTGSTRTPAQTDVAYFWTDNFAVQWNRALRAIAEAHITKIGDRARLFALANLSVADALITSWDSKRFYNYWRPVTAIQEGEFDGNASTVGDTAWQPLINTPNYPDYTSGANNVTGAMTYTLKKFFKTDLMPFAVTSNAANVVQRTRNYTSFSQAANEVVEARILLGIHFRFADTAARLQGEQVAKWVQSRFLIPLGSGVAGLPDSD